MAIAVATRVARGLARPVRLGSDTWWKPGAVMDMDFVGNRYRGATSAQLTVSRALAAYFDDPSGNWLSFATNTARIIQNRGMLVEEARTNTIRNNSMQGATNGAIGSGGALPTNWGFLAADALTCTVVGTGTELGVDYIDLRFNGTTSGTFLTFYFDANLAVTAGQTWSESFFCKLVAGSLANISNCVVSQRYNVTGTTDQVFTPNSTLTRYASTGAVPATNTGVYPCFAMAFSASSAIDVTLRIGWPQEEQGATATSPIRTTTVAVTRPADAINLTSTAFSSWYAAATTGTWFAEGACDDNTGGSGVRRLMEVTDGTANNRHVLGLATTNQTRNLVSTAGVSQADMFSAATFGSAAPFRMAAAFAANDFQQATNGVAAALDNAGTVPSVSQLTIGADVAGTSGTHANRIIRRIAFIPSRLTGTALTGLAA